MADIGTLPVVIAGAGALATAISLTWGLTARASNKILGQSVERLEGWTGDQEKRVRGLEVKTGTLEGRILTEIEGVKDRLDKIEKHMNGRPT